MLTFERATPEFSPVATDLVHAVFAATQRTGSGRRQTAARNRSGPATKPKGRKEKPSATFKPGKIHEMSAAGSIEFMGIPPTVLDHILRDGRIVGLLLEHALAAVFRNLTVVSDKSAPYDLILTDAAPGAQRFEHKVITPTKGRRKADIAPSASKGFGRKYSRKAFVKWLRSIDGVIISDVREFPNRITVRSFSRDDLCAMGYPRYLAVDDKVPPDPKKARSKR